MKYKEKLNIIYQYLISKNIENIENYKISSFMEFYNENIINSNHYYLVKLYCNDKDKNGNYIERHIAVPKYVLKPVIHLEEFIEYKRE